MTIELKNGEIYRGLLQEAEDTMNCQLKEGKINCKQYRNFITHICTKFITVTMTARNGRVQKLESVFLRGGHIKFIVLRGANCSKYASFIEEQIRGDGLVHFSNVKAHYAKAKRHSFCFFI